MDRQLWKDLYRLVQKYTAQMQTVDTAPGNDQLCALWDRITKDVANIAGSNASRFPMCRAALQMLDDVQRSRMTT